MAGPPMDFRSLLSRAAAMGPSSWAAAPGGPVAISFGGGLPDPVTFPVEELAAAAERVLRRDGAAALQYGGLMGYEGLRQQVAARLARQAGRTVDIEQVILTSGSAQALSLACFAFLEPGDTVLVEEPTFPGSLRAIRAYGADLAPVPLDEGGLVVEALQETLSDLRRQGRRPKLLYAIPNFHNPAGVTMALERRRRLVELARQHGFLIVEDDAYGDLRYEGERQPPLFALDDSGLVITLGSFSKVLAAGLRLGWAAGHQEAIAALASVRHDMGSSPFVARTVAEFAAGGRLEAHVARLVGHYRRKRDQMVAALGESCGPTVRWRTPEGGFFIWLALARDVDPERLARAAADEGVGYVPGPSFFARGGGRQNLRLAFSGVPEEEIQHGIAALGRALARCAES